MSGVCFRVNPNTAIEALCRQCLGVLDILTPMRVNTRAHACKHTR